jgi:hypothetical protein
MDALGVGLMKRPSNDNNMGASTREQLEDFWGFVGDQLGLPLTFRWTKTEPSICLNSEILMRESLIGKYPWEGYQEILHEVAHAVCPEDRKHGEEFHSEFARLIQTFLGVGCITGETNPTS